MKSKGHLMHLAEEHLKEFLPARYQELEGTGELQAKLENLAEQTIKEMTQLMERGMREFEAWEVVREKYILVKPEADPYQAVATEEDRANQARLGEMMADWQETQRVIDAALDEDGEEHRQTATPDKAP